MKLSVQDLNLSYGDQHVLDGLEIALDDVQALVVIGPSGGGKSTFLRVLAGLEQPESGRVRFNGTDMVFEEKWLREYRKGVGMVFQAYNLFPHWTALQNIVVPLQEVHGVPKDEAQRRALDLLGRFGLAEHAHKVPAELSGGQQQRIAIARALAIDLGCLLLDEPTSALDPQLTHEVLDMILDLRERGTDLVLVTHEVAFARSAADYVVFIDQGRVVEHGPAATLFDHPETEALSAYLDHVL